jgi:PAS domain S-box-containing protein
VSAALPHEVYRDVLESLETGVCLVDGARRILFWNDGAQAITGYLRHDVIGRCCGETLLMHSDENDALLCGKACLLAEVMRDGVPKKLAVHLQHKDGYQVPVRVHAFPIRDENGRLLGAAESFFQAHSLECGAQALDSLADDGCLHEFSQPADEELVAAALYDHLDDHAQRGTPFGVLCVRIDGLEQLRVMRGVQAAEKMLWSAARTLAGTLGPKDLLGEWRKEDLVVITSPCPEGTIWQVAERLRALSDSVSIRWWGESVSVTFSVGGTTSRPGDTPETVLQRAREAEAASLAAGGDRVTIC